MAPRPEQLIDIPRGDLMDSFESDCFSLDISHRGDRSRVTVTGELDVRTSNTLRDGVACCVDNGARTVDIDGSGITFISAAGITALIDCLTRCQDAAIPLNLDLSDQVRKVLDMVGLWWLGVVDDGVSVHLALQRALRAYAENASDLDKERRGRETA